MMGKMSWDEIGSLMGLPLGLLCLVYVVLRYKKRMSLEDKVVLITGATSGLGEACAKIFVKAGCKVILGGRSEAKLKKTQTALLEQAGDSAAHKPQVLCVDLEDLQSLPARAQQAIDIEGRIDILINNAGISYRGQIEDTSLEVDQKVMLVNYFGQIALTKAILPSMTSQGGGYVVGISSVQGKFSIPYRSAYSASKHAFQAFLDCLRAEVCDQNIHVLVVSPGYVKTNISVNAVRGDGSKHGVMDKDTTKGMSPDYVAEQILDAVSLRKSDLVIAPLVPRLAAYIRTLFPNLFFSLMARRAKKQKINYIKNK